MAYHSSVLASTITPCGVGEINCLHPFDAQFGVKSFISFLPDTSYSITRLRNLLVRRHSFFRGEQHYPLEFKLRTHPCRDSPWGRFGSSAKQNVATDEELVRSRDGGDSESTNGSPSSLEEASGSSKADSDNSSFENLESFLSQVEEQKRNEDVPFPVAGPDSILDTLILICPFFLWGTAMVAMKGLLPKAGPMFVAAVRLIPAGFLLVGYGAYSGKKQPTGLMAWLSIALFGLIDAACFQGFLVEGLKRTSAGLGSVIIDSQPLTVAVLASLLFGESLGFVNYMGLVLGIVGLLLLEVPFDSLQSFYSSAVSSSGNFLLSGTTLNGLASWEGGEWRMLVAAQSMAVGTVMVRWVCQYSDPFMATGWHLVLGGIPLLALAVIQQDPALNGHIQDLSVSDWSALLYTSVGGSAISYGVFFYNATRGSLTKLSSLTFLTPMFAALFGFLCLNETLTPLQFLGGVITLGGVLLVNYKPSVSIPVEDVNNKPL
ncbi:unnamed protein product [Calypogeia fissa]